MVKNSQLNGSFIETKCVLFHQGDACTSCPSLGPTVADGVAVSGPKGERGEPGPPGEGKPGMIVGNVYLFIHFRFSVLWRIA